MIKNAKILKLSKSRDGDLLMFGSNTVTQAEQDAIVAKIDDASGKTLQPVKFPLGISLDDLVEAEDGDMLVLLNDQATEAEIQVLQTLIKQKLGKKLVVVAVKASDDVQLFSKRGH